MRRFLTVVEGPGKGVDKPLDKPYMLVGRSHVADVQIEGEDLLISRRHLEVRIKDDGVFVKDISSKGSSLNGKPLKGEVSLIRGDMIELGHTKLRYEETDGGELSSPPGQPSDETQAAPPELDRTRLAATVPAPAGWGSNGSRTEAGNAEATHAVLEDNTRMLNPVELPGWKSPVRKGSRSNRMVWIGVILSAVLLAATAGFWRLYHSAAVPADASIPFKDLEFGYRVEYPSDWSKTVDKAGLIGFGFGDEKSPEWARLHIYSDKNPQHSVTGLTYGFTQYQETLRTQFKGIDFVGGEQRTVNSVTLIFFGFSTSNLKGVGFYVLNADTRIVMECFRSRSSGEHFGPAFNSILKSFRLTGTDQQQFIDFPLPEPGMKRLALSSPAELSRKVDDHARRGDALVASKDVSPDSLFRALHEYRQALQLAVAGPKPLPACRPAAEGLRQATQLYNQAVEEQRFEMNRVLKAKDQTAAYWAATRLMQMVPDKGTPAYQEAYKVLRSVEVPK